MIYVIISDIHGNREAFRAVSEDLSEIREKEIFCAGDIVGYGADPEECVRLARRLGAVCVMGNHDAAAVDMTDIARFNEYAKEAVLWTRDILSDTAKEYLRALPYTYSSGHFTLAHGTLHEPEAFIYMMTGADAMHTFEVLETQVCFVGHSHVPGVFAIKGGKIFYSRGSAVKIEKGARYIVNAGSIGQPRDGDNRACYCIYDTDKEKIEFRRIEYDITEAQRKIRAAGLPAKLADRLGYGR